MKLLALLLPLCAIAQVTPPLTIGPKADDSSGGYVAFREKRANGTNTVTLSSPDSIASNLAFKLPAVDVSGCIKSDGYGVLTIGTCVGTGSLFPDTDALYDIGAFTSRWKDSYQSGTMNSGSAVVLGTVGADILTANRIYATSISAPGTPTVTANGVDQDRIWGYKIVATLSDGTQTQAGAEGLTLHGALVLDNTAYNALTWTAVTGAAGYEVWLTTSGAFPAGTLGKLASVVAAAYDHKGAVPAGAGAPPTGNETGTLHLTGHGRFDGYVSAYDYGIGAYTIVSNSRDLANIVSATVLGTTATDILRVTRPALRSTYWNHGLNAAGDLYFITDPADIAVLQIYSTGAAPYGQFYGSWFPYTSETYDIGNGSWKWKDAYFSGWVQGKHKSGDGTGGVTVTTCTGFKDGICVSGT